FHSATATSLRVERSADFPSENYQGLRELLAEFLQGEKPEVIAVGVAGPVTSGVAEVTNLPWVVIAADLEKEFGCHIHLMNDLQAHGYGLGSVPKDALVCLQKGREQVGNRALIAAGTG